MHVWKKIINLLAVILITACSLDYGEELETELSEDIPDTVLNSFTQVVVRNGKPTYIISAEKAETYEKKNEVHLDEIVFTEYDKENNIATDGTADKAIYFSDSEDAEISNNLYLYSASEEASLEGDYLYWNKENRQLQGKSTGYMELNKDSGTSIRGKGLRVDMKSLSVEFDSEVEGVWTDEEETE